MITPDDASPALTWQKWQTLQQRHIQSQQEELSDPDDYSTEEDRADLYAQPCPLCQHSGPWQRDSHTVTFIACGHSFGVPKKPTPPAPRARRADDVFEGYDDRTGTFAFDDGTLLATAKFMWTQTMEDSVEHWRITTTVAKGSYVPVGTVTIERAELKVGPPTGTERFTLDKAFVAVIDEDLPRPVITIKWKSSDRRPIGS
ncbi:hypothetical protein [Streptomyces sioyaensis]|uniref:hypothetical protein n=1 Tax=Streptomyces sioyaensis TaxID=67364 RepID=UPI003EBD4670